MKPGRLKGALACAYPGKGDVRCGTYLTGGRDKLHALLAVGLRSQQCWLWACE